MVGKFAIVTLTLTVCGMEDVSWKPAAPTKLELNVGQNGGSFVIPNVYNLLTFSDPAS